MVKKEIFSRYVPRTATIATEIIRDNLRIPDGYKRVYTVVSAVNGTTAPTKIRFGLTFDLNRNHFYEEEPTPLLNTYYTTRREYHARLTQLGVIAMHGCVVGDLIVANFHGYEQQIGIS